MKIQKNLNMHWQMIVLEYAIFLSLFEIGHLYSTLSHKVELKYATRSGTPLLEIYFHVMRMRTMPWMLFIHLQVHEQVRHLSETPAQSQTVAWVLLMNNTALWTSIWELLWSQWINLPGSQPPWFKPEPLQN